MQHREACQNDVENHSNVLGMVLSLWFWFTLLIAAVVYAAIALSPGVLELESLRAKYLANQRENRAVRGEIDHLTKLSVALESDHQFVERLHNEEFRTHSADEMRVPVARSLKYDARVPVVTKDIDAPASRLSPFEPLISHVGQPGLVRERLKWLCVGLVLFAFFCLNEAFFATGLGAILVSCLQLIGRRYQTAEGYESQTGETTA